MSRVTCNVSHVTCHVSHVTCHMSHVTFFLLLFFWTKWWSLLVEGLLSTGPTPSSFVGFISIASLVLTRISPWHSMSCFSVSSFWMTRPQSGHLTLLHLATCVAPASRLTSVFFYFCKGILRLCSYLSLCWLTCCGYCPDKSLPNIWQTYVP